ncbi:FlgD immunoglobulin-like domain containing protein [Streptomyces sp. NPDC127114]|uniref:FlgD immunoglobulin-like domain containing protein n=1 Tax=Streptomyces sp. NPDC127114 TaxID=3345366 RepID=UPI00363875AA
MYLRTRGALAFVTAVGMTVGLSAALTTPALAADTLPADEVVVPDPGRHQPRLERLISAGTTGYLHRQEGVNDLLWTDTATGASTAQPLAAQYGHSGLYASYEAGTARIVDVATRAVTEIPLPAGRSWLNTYTADTVVARTDQDGVTSALTLVRLADGGTTETPVTGVPTDLGLAVTVTQDTRGAIIRFSADGSARFYLDYGTATLVRLSGAFPGTANLRLGAEHVLGWSGGSSSLYTVPRSDAAATPVRTGVARPYATSEYPEFAVVGGHVVYVHSAASYDADGVLRQKLQEVPLGGGPVRDLLPAGAKGFVTAPDGSVLVVGGTSATDWAVHRVSPGDGGAPVTEVVRKVPQVPATYSGLALGGGRLSYLSDSTSALKPGTPALFDVDTTATGTPAATAPELRHRLWQTPHGLRSLGDGNSVYGAGTAVEAPTDDSYRYTDLPAQSTVVDAAGRYVLARNGDTTYAVDLDLDNLNQNEVRLTLNKSAAALWGSQVWKPATATSTGQVNAYDLKSGATSAPVELGSGCRPTELQAVGRWLYWACGADKAGVYDRTLKKNVPVTAGESLLGDGFVVRHDRTAHKLLLTNAATGQTSDLATVPAWADADGRGGAWTVDKFGANVAFVDAEQNIHVKRVPVAPQPFVMLDTFERRISGGTTQLRWRTSRSVGAWKVEIREASGTVVRTYQGARGNGAGVAIDWDSRDQLGRGLEDATYTYVMTAQPADGTGAALRSTGSIESFDVGLSTLPGTYTPLTPARLMDTRNGLGTWKGKVGPGETRSLEVAGAGGVPRSGLTAVVLNVTATNATAGGFVSVYPTSTYRTSASSLNFAAGQTVSNLVTVPVVNGFVNFYNKNGSVDLIADVAGYYTAGTEASAYQPVTPTRLMDTRDGTGVPQAKIPGGGTVTLPVTEPGATAVALNVTATNATSPGFVSVYPYGTARPNVSNVNFPAGRTVPNMVVVPVRDGKITFYNRAGSVDVIADVAGYFKQGTGSVFTGTKPKRVMDTRTGAGVGVPQAKVGAGQTVSLTVGDQYKAVVLNVTATNPTATGFVSVYPYGTTRTAASNLNFVAGQTVANMVVVPVRDGKITFYNRSGSVDLVADMAGYYTG